MTSSQTAQRFFFLLLLIATVLVAMVARPVASALFLSLVLAAVLWPIHVRLSRRLGGRRGLSAGLFVVGVTLLLVGPVVAFSAFAIKEGTAGVKYLSEALSSEGTVGLIKRLPDPLDGWVQKGLESVTKKEGAELDDSVQKGIRAQGGKAAAAAGAALSATGSLVFQAVMMLIALYFMLVQGNEMVEWLDGLSPLKKGQTRELLTEFKKVSYAVIMSTVITAAVQATAALIGYFIARVPHPIFFAGVTFFAAFIPAIGAGAVCLVAALVLYVTGHPGLAIFMAAWGLIIVGLVDNVVKPLLIKAGMEMRGAVVFFALVGGLGAFGTIGILLGPLVVAFFLALLRMYQRDFKPA